MTPLESDVMSKNAERWARMDARREEATATHGSIEYMDLEKQWQYTKGHIGDFSHIAKNKLESAGLITAAYGTLGVARLKRVKPKDVVKVLGLGGIGLAAAIWVSSTGPDREPSSSLIQAIATETPQPNYASEVVETPTPPNEGPTLESIASQSLNEQFRNPGSFLQYIGNDLAEANGIDDVLFGQNVENTSRFFGLEISSENVRTGDILYLFDPNRAPRVASVANTFAVVDNDHGYILDDNNTVQLLPLEDITQENTILRVRRPNIGAVNAVTIPDSVISDKAFYDNGFEEADIIDYTSSGHPILKIPFMYVQDIEEVAGITGIDWEYIAAIWNVESRFDRNAHNAATNDWGLPQGNISTLRFFLETGIYTGPDGATSVADSLRESRPAAGFTAVHILNALGRQPENGDAAQVFTNYNGADTHIDRYLDAMDKYLEAQ